MFHNNITVKNFSSIVCFSFTYNEKTLNKYLVQKTNNHKLNLHNSYNICKEFELNLHLYQFMSVTNNT